MRVIQDSDDEFEEDIEVVPLPPKPLDASTAQHERANDASSGTGSTESLKRAFAEVHRALLQSPSVPSGAPQRTEPQSSVSLPEHTSKRRKTSVDVSPRNSPFLGSTNRERVTYSKRPKTFLNSSYMNVSNHESAVPATQDDPGPTNDMNWPMEGTMQDEYVHHDPMALFPEPSSTIPNATFTQQRVLETVTGPVFLGVESGSDAPRYEPPDASVPWSEIMKFSPAATAEQSDLGNQALGQEAADAVPQTSHQIQRTSSQRSRRGSSVRLRGSPLRNEVYATNIDPRDAVPPPHDTHSSQDLGLPSSNSKKHRRETQEPQKSSQQQKSKLSSVPSSEDDLATIGLPTEQYIPRPSRSRSLKIDTQESVDYSVIPEKVAKASKRRKTTTAASTRSSNATDLLKTPQKIRQICDMGFTPISTERALKQSSGDVAQTVDWLINNGMGEDELAHKTPKREPASKDIKKNRPLTVEEVSLKARPWEEQTSTIDKTDITKALDVTKKSLAKPNPNVDEATVPSDTVILPDRAQIKSPKVQVVIPSKSPLSKSVQQQDPPTTSSKKAKRRKTTSDAPEPESTLEPLVVHHVPVEKKKRRGRPKKIANSALLANTVQEVSYEKLQEPGKEADEVLQTGQPTATVLNSHEGEPGVSMLAAPSEQPTATNTLTKDPPSTSSRTPEPSTKIAAGSPASKGKVSYRVGLSKRARIAPLLRTLKK
ncbi:hypothetical protein CC86DRAFT_451044 [Ophiobolus disseminans]|uniref:UBA domain-containing protein n=1 Tax=Ophiobolus disseminans TaxID=1469910 RepID=A0A6A7AJ31_9PLEO|nr:hypothetical protein CC86DRAFT_451044 [Ophiobolus disseminans]